MLKSLKSVRAAASLLNPDEVRSRAERPLSIGLVAADGNGYADMEEFLLPASVSAETRVRLIADVHRAGMPGAPERFDLLLCEQGLPCPPGAHVFHRRAPEVTVERILHDADDLSLRLARSFPVFRKPVVEAIVHAVSRENALFVIATALPNVIPSLIELPWSLGEFASDTTFLTLNQIRMAFLVAAACGGEVGIADQKTEVLSIVAGAFGWRALARELAGKIPMGGGLIPKGAIAYAGTFVIGKGLEHYHQANRHHTRAQRREIYQQAYERGKSVARTITEEAR